MSDLSPAVQAVLDAYYDAAKAVLNICGDFEVGSARNKGIAAALRALADQVVPHPGRYPMNSYMDGIRDAKQDVRAAILAIATELEGQP
jgi:hypothetical protein